MVNIPTPKRLRERDEKLVEPVRFAPIRRNPLKKQTRVTMLKDVGGKFRKPGYRFSLSAGKSYWLDEDVADSFIIKRYASGQLSRTYSDDEVAAIRANIQTITLDHGVLQDG